MIPPLWQSRRRPPRFSVLAAAILKSPLLHFFVVGAIAFLALAAAGDDEEATGEDESVIVVPGIEVLRMRELFRARMERDPADGELDAMIHDYVRDEVMFREGLRAKLHLDDNVVRRRMVELVEALVIQSAAIAEPDEAELRAWYAAHQDRFRTERRLSISHIYLGRGREADTREELAAEVLAALRSDTPLRDVGTGRLRVTSFPTRTESQVISTFGEDFVARLADLEVGTWNGPLDSPYGRHVVRVDQREDSTVPAFEEVRDDVASDWLRAQRAEADTAELERLMQRYEVIEDAAEAAE